MTSQQQIVTVNVHNPRVQSIVRHDNGRLCVTLGNGKFQAHVNVFMTDAEWFELRAAILVFQAAERRKSMPAGDRYCPECNYIGHDVDDVTEHVFLKHPEEVAK